MEIGRKIDFPKKKIKVALSFFFIEEISALPTNFDVIRSALEQYRSAT
jgi:hypothetical protein